MSRYHSHINTALQVLSGFKEDKPFVFHLKHFFSAQKKYGSKDRRSISQICYHWFRVARLFQHDLHPENLYKAAFLCSDHPSPLLEYLSPELNDKVQMPVLEKLAFLQKDPLQLFPFADELGDDIDAPGMAISFLTQPDLFIRIRPGKESRVLQKLNEAGVGFEKKRPGGLALPNASKLDDLLDINREVVIQDLNSQKVLDGIPKELLPVGHLKIWDCCAASGGKSILVFDKLNSKAKLTLSDIRKTILHNCMQRLKVASVPVQQHFVADLSIKLPFKLAGDFDMIICDAPCTGSGTWSRTPEQLARFKKEEIERFALLQKAIAGNVTGYLKPGGLFVYITCSVFKKENEEVVVSIEKNEQLQLHLISSGYLEGYFDKADTMYVALFKKAEPIE